MFIFVILIAFIALRLLVELGGNSSKIIGMCLTNSDTTLSATCIIEPPIFIRVRYLYSQKLTAVIP